MTALQLATLAREHVRADWRGIFVRFARGQWCYVGGADRDERDNGLRRDMIALAMAYVVRRAMRRTAVNARGRK